MNEQSRLIEQVREGMIVIDADGVLVGPVQYLQMGDPEAATTEGQGDSNPAGGVALGDTLGDEINEPDAPEPLRSRLLRCGFLKIDGPGPEWYDTDLYVRADAITEVAGDIVRVSVRRREMIPEGSAGQRPDRDTAPVLAGSLWWALNRAL
jgi:hypothetical protein